MGTDAQKISISNTKSRLAQLASIFQMQYEAIFKRAEHARMAARLGNGLKEGVNGQARLTFSRGGTAQSSVQG